MRPLYKMVSLMGVEPITKRFWAVRVCLLRHRLILVRVIGLEPIKCCHHSALNAMRLPVSPHTHILNGGPGWDWTTDERILSPPLYLWVSGPNGACNATWTHDLTRTKGVLYQLSYTSILKSTLKWCERRDSNSYTLRHRNLNPARLPIPPRPLMPSAMQRFI